MDLSSLIIGARYTRPELAETWGYETYRALGRGVITPKKTNLIILFVTRVKQSALTQYDDSLSGDLLYWEGEAKHGSDNRVIGAAAAGDEVHLFYREIHHSPFEYKGRVRLLGHDRRTDRPSRFVFRLDHDQGVTDDLERFRSTIEAVPGVTEREELRKARVGQGRFRKALMDLWGGRCAVTGVGLPAVLMASHIKPWRSSKNVERLDPHNGLLLLPQYDKLFDRGYLTFADSGAVVASQVLPKDWFAALGIREDRRLSRVEPEHWRYFAYHRERVFIARTTDG